MKLLLLLLSIPFFSAAQTVHIKDGEIEYKETVKLKGISKEILQERAQKILRDYVKNNDDENNKNEIESGQKDTTSTENQEQDLETTGKIKLTSPYSIIRILHYTIKIDIEDGEYKYKIDSVYIKQKVRGGKTKVIPSEDLVKDMEVTGVVAIETEKQLNEIDMKFQKLIYHIKSTMKNNGKSKATRNKNKV